MSATNYVTQEALGKFATKVDSVFARKTSIPTNVSDLTNDSGFVTSTEVGTAIGTAIAGVTQFDYEIVQSLPGTGEKGVIYLIANSGSGTNIYDEYIYISTDGGTTYTYELIGTREVTVTEYIGTATITVTDGTGNDAGKKVISVKYDSDDFATDSTDGLQLSSAVHTSLGKADSALQSLTSTGNVSSPTVVITGNGTTKNLEVSATIVSGAAAGATAVQPGDLGVVSDEYINGLFATS